MPSQNAFGLTIRKRRKGKSPRPPLQLLFPLFSPITKGGDMGKNQSGRNSIWILAKLPGADCHPERSRIRSQLGILANTCEPGGQRL